VSTELFEADDCSIEEACVLDAGWRDLLRFTTTTANLGTGDLALGIPTDDPDRFTYSECHGHYHLSNYIEYDLLDAGGASVATGRKQAFCLMDTEPVSGFSPPHYFCGDQGITTGWADTYPAEFDCQWLDVTGVAPGDYTLRLTVDPTGIFEESDTTDNTAEVPITLGAYIVTDACTTTSNGEFRDCGWADAGTFACTPAEELTLACEGACDGTCTGDPVLRVCDGATPDCRGSAAIGNNDDADCGSSCSSLTFTCPDSGSVQALTAAWSSDEAGGCAVVRL
jgi:hypothetical protein